ncbi:hemerythrin domain-containing protein [Halobacteriovorax sp.]|uniref:hemerythrin domain-containing protein n=1 Tax=Halobacteriovorax sp. TaxID=2020862 RepID=UPI003AF2C7C7
MSAEFKAKVEELISYHQIIRNEFKTLMRRSYEIEEKYQDDPNIPKGLSNFFIRFWITIEADMQKEESHLFPLLLSDELEGCEDIKEILEGHEEQELELKELMAKVQGYELCGEVNKEWTEFVKDIKRVVLGINIHMDRENEILFEYLCEVEESSSLLACS